MTTVESVPRTIEDRLQLPDEMRIAASWDEFLDLVYTSPYRIEYYDGEIISFMSYATLPHEALVAELIRLIGNMLPRREFKVVGSSIALHVPLAKKNYYNPDCAVIFNPPEYIPLKGNMKAVTNPALIVEVLSKSTMDHDLGLKGHQYKEIPSLQQMLFVDSRAILVESHTRQNGDSEWLVKQFRDPASNFKVLDQGVINVGDLYQEISFE